MNTGMLKRPKASMDRLVRCSCGKAYRIKPKVTPGPRQCMYCGAQFMIPPLPSGVSPSTPTPREIGVQKMLNSNPVASAHDEGRVRRDPNQPLRSVYSARNESRLNTGDDVPPGLLVSIRAGSRVAFFSAFLTGLLSVALIMSTSVASHGSSLPGSYGVLMLFDVALLLLMAYGISRKSRIASTCMVVYFLLNMVVNLAGLANSSDGSSAGLGGGIFFFYLIFGLFYVNAMVATYRYHNLVRTA